MDKIKSKLDFLERVADEFTGTLNAFSAILRLETLIDDAERAAGTFALLSPAEKRYGFFSPDIGSYYTVGYVTCLEWHARTRLADLFTYAPSTITDDDLTKEGGNRGLRKLIAAKGSIPQFLAATRNYSSPEAYLGTFGRIFDALDIRPDPKRVVHGVTVPPQLVAEYGQDALENLYKYRNTLVHEINASHLGHPVHHNPLSLEDAIAYGRLTENVIRAIEAAITSAAPSDFPNKLLPDGHVDARLDQEILRLEVEISGAVKGFATALTASRAAMAAEEEMLLHADVIHSRWLDFKAPVRRALRQGRLQYLKALRDIVGE